MDNNQIIIYQTEDGLTKIDVTLENETVWLNQDQMAELFQRDRTVITKHVGNIFREGELDEKSNVQFLHVGCLEEAYIIESIKQYSPKTKKELSYYSKIFTELSPDEWV